MSMPLAVTAPEAVPEPGMAPGSPRLAALSQVAALQQRISSMQATKLETLTLPTLPAMADILPGGALRQGAAYSVEGSTTLVMALLAGPSQGGAWCGVVGLPDFGAEAATRFGIDLDRLVLVPAPGDQWLTVTAALVDVLSVVVIKPSLHIRDADVARLGARLRQRGCTLIVMGGWPQSEAVLRIEGSRWSGLGRGHGYLTGREVTVASVGNRGFDRPQRASLWLPDAEQQFRAGGTSSAGASSSAGGTSSGIARPPRPTAVPPLREAAG
jgi:membrane protein implicated in regulation of membrane protease activity